MKNREGEVPLPHMSDANICEPSVMYCGGEFGLGEQVQHAGNG